MKTILSLDLDIAMSPYIGIYNNLIATSNRKTNWSEIKFCHNIEDFKVNQEYKNLLIQIIQHYQQQVDKVYVGEDHGTILKAIDQQGFQFNNLDIYNIDYHHDINYHIDTRVPNEQVAKLFKENAVNAWAGWLMYNGSTYHWYNGAGSMLTKKFFMTESIIKLNKQYEQHLFDSTFPMDLDIDLLYITPSLPWIPETVDKDFNDILNAVDATKIVKLTGDMKDESTCNSQPILH